MDTFTSLGISSEILKIIEQKNFVTPTTIQKEAIPKLLSNNIDFIGLAQTGTGKTAAFSIPLIDLTDDSIESIQSLIVAPTRELAQQIYKEIKELSKNKFKIRVEILYGGVSISTQLKNLKLNRPHILISTPGRLLDILNRGKVNLSNVKRLILDEADEMLSMGFKEDINLIISNTPSDKNIWLFSATMPREIRQIIKNYMINPYEINVNQKVIVNDNISHHFMLVKNRCKILALKRYLDITLEAYMVIFCKTKLDTQNLADELIEAGYNTDAIHGDLTQDKRNVVMNRFRKKITKILVATDVAARGIDVENLTHVIHYALPDDSAYYTHRSGRTARAGNQGKSIAIIVKSEYSNLKRIEKTLKISFNKIEIPNVDQIMGFKLQYFVQKINNINDFVNNKYTEKIIEELSSYKKDELIQRIVTNQLNSLDFNIYKQNIEESEQNIRNNNFNNNSNSLKSRKNSKFSKNKSKNFENSKSMYNMFINAGKQDKLTVPELLNYIHKKSGINKRQIGDIKLRSNHIILEIPKSLKNEFIKNLNGTYFKGKNIIARLDSK